MAIIGYARVSTQEQNLDLQLIALRAVGCEPIFEDLGVSATARRRPGFEQALAALKAGDVFVIWKMDRAFRSVISAARLLDEFESKDIRFKCLTEPIDTTTSAGRCMYHVRNAFSEMESSFIRERTVAGLDAARKRGVKLGRPRKLTSRQVEAIRCRLNQEPQVSRAQMARKFGVSPQTLSRALSNPPPKGTEANGQASGHTVPTSTRQAS